MLRKPGKLCSEQVWAKLIHPPTESWAQKNSRKYTFRKYLSWHLIILIKLHYIALILLWWFEVTVVTLWLSESYIVGDSI